MHRTPWGQVHSALPLPLAGAGPGRDAESSSTGAVRRDKPAPALPAPRPVTAPEPTGVRTGPLTPRARWGPGPVQTGVGSRELQKQGRAVGIPASRQPRPQKGRGSWHPACPAEDANHPSPRPSPPQEPLPQVSRKAKCSCHFQQLSSESSSKRLRKSRFCSLSKFVSRTRHLPRGGAERHKAGGRRGGSGPGWGGREGRGAASVSIWAGNAGSVRTGRPPPQSSPGEVSQQAPPHRPEVCSGHRAPSSMENRTGGWDAFQSLTARCFPAQNFDLTGHFPRKNLLWQAEQWLQRGPDPHPWSHEDVASDGGCGAAKAAVGTEADGQLPGNARWPAPSARGHSDRRVSVSPRGKSGADYADSQGHRPRSQHGSGKGQDTLLPQIRRQGPACGHPDFSPVAEEFAFLASRTTR